MRVLIAGGKGFIGSHLVNYLKAKGHWVRDVDKPQGVQGRNADLTLVRHAIGWGPKVSLEDGLRTTYDRISKMVKK